MRYAVMSDVHANPKALAKAVVDAWTDGADAFVCLGDIVGYGPSPADAVDLAREVFGSRVVMGNHDAALLGEMPIGSFSRRAQKSIAAQRCMVGEENLRWLKSCPPLVREGPFLFVHGDVCRDGDSLKAGFGYVFRSEDAKRVLSAVEGVGVNIVFVGHTHKPTIWRLKDNGEVGEIEDERISVGPSDRCVINVGTVGCPRCVPYASYAVVDVLQSGCISVELCRVRFDFVEYRDSLVEANADVPIWLEDLTSR